MILESRPAAYIARTSYAVYVIHGMLGATWLGGEQATKVVRYALRPVLVVATFALAHVSTFYFENRWIALGKRLTVRANPSLDARAQLSQRRHAGGDIAPLN
jgi:peptidoglycan/LPS O-acetylase OafA/YrhL